MHAFRDFSIKAKLTTLLIGIVSLVLTLSGVAFVIKDMNSLKSSMVVQYTTLADVLGANSTVAIAFDTPADAEGVLDSLRLEPTVVFAAIYVDEGREFARYSTTDKPGIQPDQTDSLSEGFEFRNGFLHLKQPIIEGDEQLGTIYLTGTLEQLYKQLWRDIMIGAGVLVVCLIAAVLLASFLQRWISGPIMNLAQAMSGVSNNDDYSIRVERQGNDELGVLCDGFNSMLEQIQQRDQVLASEINERKRAEKRFRVAVDSAPTAMIMINSEGEVVLLNAEAIGMFGFSRDESIGSPIEQFLPEGIREPHVGWRNQYFESPKSVTLSGDRELAGRRHDGSEFPVEIGLSPIETEDGIFALAAISDVSVRKEAEKKMREMNTVLEERVTARTEALEQRTSELSQVVAELERSNQELDEFAYIASHDLKEPLRGISNYASFLVEDYADSLDEDGQHKLATLQRLCKRLEDLINSLLMYSRVGRAEMALQTTDLNVLLDEILDSLHVTLNEKNVDVRLPERLPTVTCDRVRIGEVFRNLITNAYKYNDKKEKWIEVGFSNGCTNGKQESDELVLHVRDNGIGIREKHIDSIFRIFKRLHGRDKFGGGTGAGLTFVKKIVERHGGRIWVQSTHGEGSTFFFTLTKADS